MNFHGKDVTGFKRNFEADFGIPMFAIKKASIVNSF